jgi:hypothetical protein
MRFPAIFPGILLTLILGQLIFSVSAPAEVVTHIEEFDSWRWRDPDLTTADWDTVQGSLHLFPVGLDSLTWIPVPGVAYASAIADTVLLAADGGGQLLSFGVGDPTAANALDTFATADDPRDVTTDGNWAYLAIGNLGLQTVNCTDPADLVAGGQLDLAGFAYALAIKNTRLYAAQSGQGVAVVNITSPWSPTLVTDVPTQDWARDVAVSGNQLLVADSEAGLTVMDISLPDQPAVIGNLPTATSCLAVSAAGNRAFLATGSGGLVVVDLADPTEPIQLGSLTFPASANCRSVTAAGDTVYAAVNDRGLFVIDVSDPTDPVIIGSKDTPGTAYHVAVSGTVSWLSDGTGGLRAFELNPFALDETRNLAFSLNLASSGEPVSRARLDAVTTDSLRFDLTVDGGLNWLRAEPGGDYVEFAEAGEDFRWRAVLVATGEQSAPSCSRLEITYEKLHGYGGIQSVTDVPQDTGGQVRLTWSPSRFDAAGEEYQVTEYSIFRRYDPDGQAAPLLVDGGGLPYPPGSWDYVASVPADMESSYSTVVPTLQDSTITDGMAWSVFFIRSRTAATGVFFDSPPDSGYSLNNLQPAPPTGFVVDRSPADGTQLSWNPPAIADFAHFRIYRAASPDTPALPGTLYHVTTGTEHFDPDPGLWHYLLTVVNLAGQESEPATGLSHLPGGLHELLLHQNAPNPFNPSTSIHFVVPAGGAPVRLAVYDARGRLVRRLLDDFLAEGEQSVRWDGRDGQGQAAASGVYQARLEASGRSRVVKMLLLR